MRITVFGAAGNVGKRVVDEALSRGHQVTAVVRRAGRFEQLNAALKAGIGDVGNLNDVLRLSEGQDLVISATRPPKGCESELIASTRCLLTASEQSGVRLLLVGGAASLTVPGSQGTLVVDDPKFVSPAWKDIALACLAQYKLCSENANLDWTYLSPPALIMPGQRSGKYRLGNDELIVDTEGNSQISLEDFAVALMDEAERPQYRQKRFTVAY
jgi:putative NADH-flavin reductase